jgi:holin-like protein
LRPATSALPSGGIDPETGMIQGLALLLTFQLAGEVAARALGLSLPGPVLGMAALLLVFLVWPRLPGVTEPVAQGLLGHLSLLFVLAIVVSTVLAIAVGALSFALVARLTGSDE